MFTKPSREIAPWTRLDVLACAAAALLGLVLAIEPHLANLATKGTLAFVTDGDDLLYLEISRVPFYEGWELRDPFATPDQHVPTLYAWFQFVPMAKLARLLGLSAVTTSFLWRAIGGPMLGAALFGLFRQILGGTKRPAAWALGCSMICLSDPGFIAGRPLIRDFLLLRNMLHMPEMFAWGNQPPQYRVVTPLVNLPWLVLLAALLVPGGRRGWWTCAAGAICLGLCFQLYFFFWTAAVVAIGMYLSLRAIAWWRHRQERPEGLGELKFVAAVLAGGIILGAPQVYANARTFADPGYRPILHRMHKGREIPPGDPKRTQQLINSWPLAEIIVGGAVIVGLGLWSLGLPWCMVLAGYLLSNNAILTGLDFENDHWSYVFTPFGEVLVLALASTVLDGLRLRWKAAFWAVPIVLAAITLAWRPLESLRHRQPTDYNRLIRDLEPLREALWELSPDESMAGASAANTALLFTRAGQLYNYDHSSNSSPIPTAEVGLRFALNGWLLGWDMPRFRAEAAQRPPAISEGLVEEWIADFQSVLDGRSDELLGRFHIGALLLPADAPAPERGGPWRLAASGPKWTLWKRDAAGR